MEKFFDIVCRVGALRPWAAVLVATVRAIKHHGDASAGENGSPGAIDAGMANVRRHLRIIETFGVPAVVAVNRRLGDSDREIEHVKRLAIEAGAFAAEVSDSFTHGGAGSVELADAVARACEQQGSFRPLYDDQAPVEQKIESVARRVYGAKDVFFYPEAQQNIAQFTRDGLGGLPVSIAKTHLSLSADASLRGAPEGFTLQVRDVRAYTGAGWLVALCGEITQMPGLGKRPAALDVDIDDEGRTVGLF